MAKAKKVQISALNIALHKPHSPQMYVNLLQMARRRQLLIPQGELHALMLGELYGTQNGVEHDEVWGEIYRFVKIDANEPWFNLETKKQATAQDVEEINIPSHLLAHMQKISFVFYPSIHQLWFASKFDRHTLGPQAAERFFQKLFDSICVEANYPIVNVTAIPAKSAVEDMLATHQLRHIAFLFKRPNGDEGDDEEFDLMKSMDDQGILTLTEEMHSVRGGSIKPDARSIRRAKIASRNGVVSIKGNDFYGRPVDTSTRAKPMIIFETVNLAIETVIHVLRRLKP